MEFGLPLAAVAAVSVTWIVLSKGGRRGEIDHVITAGLVGVLVGRLVAMIAVGVNPITHPLDILVLRGGVNTVGATIGAIGSLIWSTRGDLRLLDLIAPGVVAGMAMWHASCLWRAGCLGAVGKVPWGWSLPGSSLTRHPVELYAALGMTIGVVVLSRVEPGGGIRSALALAWVAGSRLVTQPLRPSLDGGPVWWYASALVGGLALSVVLNRTADRRASAADVGARAPDS